MTTNQTGSNYGKKQSLDACGQNYFVYGSWRRLFSLTR